MTKDSPQTPADETDADREVAATEAPAAEAIYSPQLTDTASLRAAWRMGLNPNTTKADAERFLGRPPGDRRGLRPDPEPQA